MGETLTFLKMEVNDLLNYLKRISFKIPKKIIKVECYLPNNIIENIKKYYFQRLY
ncbi:hypothetical protein EU99_0753 [Prochlorococcus marinus str. MIT 9321]|uniref:Uncharacterized protein n=1 Tax=Prochlorococcus marinus str. MIT 9401 TaxID=167551 RepID=A0A0A2B8B2_PROMR|nr:hypothetical protein EU99_0753 [Prochlorococcus marinus str. MIT 9321]KGG06325.1 hypothetical protein EV00_0626 [Prochlorococcus marinus str. MIT 9322]KGG10086.1 hypothetical protein EV01_0493 [Prochlorococcus marinus str. MIT 9401]